MTEPSRALVEAAKRTVRKEPRFPFKPITERAPAMTEGQKRCYDLLAEWAFGTHHLYGKVDQCERGLSYTLSGSLDTYDFNRLTTLVLLAHARCVRVEVAAAARGYLRIYLHPRVREGRIHEKHPTMSEALAAFPYCDLTSTELAAEPASPPTSGSSTTPADGGSNG